MGDNGNSSAYPIPPVLHEGGPDSYWSQHPQGGLTKREVLAMAAMQGYCAREGSIECEAEDIANDSVRLADALLAALDPTP